MTLVFVYGSLKRGFSNHVILAGAKYKGEAHTCNKYAMAHLGSFPGVVKEVNDVKYFGRILGELYEVDDYVSKRLDRLESNGSFYNREQIFVEYTNDFRRDKAWMYFLMHYDRQQFILPVNGFINWRE